MLRLVQPWPDPYTINKRSPYGPRIHPITGKRTFHHGIDVAMPQGTPLTAGADGVVAHKGSGGSGGNTLLLKHAGGMHTVYYHMQRPSPLAVGAPVKTGDVVGYVGTTGASTGPHLHFELRRSRTWRRSLRSTQRRQPTSDVSSSFGNPPSWSITALLPRLDCPQW